MLRGCGRVWRLYGAARFPSTSLLRHAHPRSSHPGPLYTLYNLDPWPFLFLPLFTNVVEEEFCELRLDGVRGSSHGASDDGIMVVMERGMERGGPWGFLRAGREGEGVAQDARSK